MSWWNWPDENIFEAIPQLQSEDIEKLWNYWKREVPK